MKILVLSDSHNAESSMLFAVQREQPDAIIHLGDLVEDARRLRRTVPSLSVYSVAGNNDWMSREPTDLFKTIDGVGIFMTHGHKYGVRRSLLNLELAAREAGARVALFGHTHQTYCERLKDGFYIMNPGACGTFHATYGVIEIAKGNVKCYNAEVRAL